VKVATCLRVSTDTQAGHGLGLDVQRQAIRAWAREYGHQVIAWHADEGISGSNGLETRLALGPRRAGSFLSCTPGGVVDDHALAPDRLRPASRSRSEPLVIRPIVFVGVFAMLSRADGSRLVFARPEETRSVPGPLLHMAELLLGEQFLALHLDDGPSAQRRNIHRGDADRIGTPTMTMPSCVPNIQQARAKPSWPYAPMNLIAAR
jgi:hypothetical protein